MNLNFRKAIPLLAGLFVFCFAVQMFSDNKADVDLWGNLSFTQALPWQAGFKTVNTYSFTDPAQPWVNHEWLGQYVLRSVYLGSGDAGLLLLKILLGLSVLGLIEYDMRREGVSGGVRFLSLLAIISTMSYGFSTRPHHFTYLLLALMLTLLRSVRRPGLLLLAIPALGFLWANLHGAFFSGIILLSVYLLMQWVDRPWRTVPGENRRYAAILAGTLLFVGVSFVNPYGSSLWGFIMGAGSVPRPYLSEWASLFSLETLAAHLDFVALVLASVASLLVVRRVRSWTWLCVLALALVAAVVLRRNIPIFAMVAGFVVPSYVESAVGGHLGRLIERIQPPIRLLGLAGMSALSLWFAATFNKVAALRIEVDTRRFPVQAMTFMKEAGVQGNMLVFFDWAEYMIWHGGETSRVFMDGRFTDAYRLETVNDYLDFLYVRTPDWDRALTKYPVDVLLLHQGNDATREMRQRQDWSVIYEDTLAVIFIRTGVWPPASFRGPAPAGHAFFP